MARAGVCHGNKLDDHSEVLRGDRLLGTCDSVEDQGWRVAGKPGLDQGARWPNPLERRGI